MNGSQVLDVELHKKANINIGFHSIDFLKADIVQRFNNLTYKADPDITKLFD